MTGRSRTERILDAYLAPEADQLPNRVLDAALDEIARTPQRRALRVPWRFPSMPNSMRLVAAAVIGVVALGVIYLNLPGRSDVGGPGPSLTATPAPTVATGIAAWKTYTSAIYGFDVGYPDDWSVYRPAAREWRTGDVFPADGLPYADAIVSPGEGDAQIALIVWQMPAGEGADIESVAGMKAWAERFCSDVVASSCEDFTKLAVPRFREGAYGSAILVPTADQQYAFVGDCNSCLLTGATDHVIVVVVAREDDFLPAARYGGSVELLNSILTTMNVWSVQKGT